MFKNYFSFLFFSPLYLQFGLFTILFYFISFYSLVFLEEYLALNCVSGDLCV